MGRPIQRVTLILEFDADGTVLTREVADCLNPQCPEEQHASVGHTPRFALAALRKWAHAVLQLMPPEGRA